MRRKFVKLFLRRSLARGTHATSVAVEEALFWGLSPSSPVENKQHPVHANLFLLTLAWEQRLSGTPGSVTYRVVSGWAHKDLRPVKQPRLRSLVVRRFEPRSGRESRVTGVCHASQSVGKLAGLARETTFEYRHKPPHFSGSGIMTWHETATCSWRPFSAPVEPMMIEQVVDSGQVIPIDSHALSIRGG